MACENGVAGMLMLSSADYQEIRTWVHRNARPLELAFWRYHFETDGAPDANSDVKSAARNAVLEALAFYRNADGGFGNALEPDSWNPESTPYTTLKTLDLLETIGMTDPKHPYIRGILDYLVQCPYATKDGWPFNIPSNDAWPHAPWWTYNPKSNVYESIGVITGLCAYILRYLTPADALRQKAERLARRMILDFQRIDNFGEMGLGGFCQLLDALDETGLAADMGADAIRGRLHGRITAAIEHDTGKWQYHVPRPSWFIHTPLSPYLAGTEAIMEAELDYLVRTRPAGGVWDIDWSWFDNNDTYPKAFAISENWWKSWCAIEKLTLLRRFGRFEA